ncbi:hypothetical protein [Clostridium cibarium]|uniref:Uncharacterized protein n=1 Tax=Clostridium cibarium TaxID=2762247 RepID=A0ABR8PSV1_9CLOT|nr:hypothetical protein [Clostridium cibarium]MBD7911247.1 hypothetical protein [Clostridium cibarium]
MGLFLTCPLWGITAVGTCTAIIKVAEADGNKTTACSVTDVEEFYIILTE